MLSFTLEIGVEEFPARFLPGLEKELRERFSAAFTEAGVPFDDLRVLSTPRRSAVLARVAANSEQREELVMGPPVRVAYDGNGNPTKAAEGFAKTQGVAMAALFRETTDKGEYLAARKTVGGEKTADVLARICPEIIESLSFPKRMHWGNGTFTFARPLRWLLAMLDNAVIPFTVGGVASGNTTVGHRVHGFGPFTLSAASDYRAVIADKCGVTVDPAERRAAIIKGGNALAEKAGGVVLWKESLLDEVQGLTEHPVPLLGGFDAGFLEIPREVLLTSMESHQKSFGVEGKDGKLLPHFCTVLNMTPPDEDLVRKGWERVLRARLEDARFFWKTDLASGFDAWLASLDAVIFLAPLGSMGDKTRRLEALCRYLAETTGLVAPDDAARAGRLSKADLVSGMVGEFDSLQGIMGGIYAAKRGETPVVAQALREQYLPAGPDTPVPASLCGAFLSLADKADTMAGCFGLGMIPTGAADPYALRRCALGIARIIEEHGLALDIEAFFAKAQSLYSGIAWKLPQPEALGKLLEFFATRLKNQMVGQGNDTLLVEAVLSSDSRDVRGAHARLHALKAFSQESDFAQTAMTFKRVANIVRKQEQEEGVHFSGTYDVSLLAEDAEKALAEAVAVFARECDSLWEQGRYEELLRKAGALRPSVDAFFDGVMVMVDDAALRRNRLELLAAILQRMGRLADFSALQM
ncbi:Glycine--tRNA ligase beta subunit [uncultured delta proteobacterium]|uniref:Glycine--tRNA ligase beta subunit n=1 Tax=uncultured delta proteobacterium TaxID=34034 RepID=A0A212J1M9_9DELT|nr:Glycine--tRNA ligase beta subunit [uncultured delta proteobacterium]